MSQPTILELCAGYNGLGMAVEEVFGARTVAFSEYDTAPSKILAHHYPDVPNYGDMTKIDWAAIEPVDIISGGTPCQDLSNAGARRGMNEGTRSNLWVNMREAIAIMRPKWVVWENVRGAFSACASSEMGKCPGCVDGRGPHKPFLRALGRVLGDLSDLGFDAEWRGLRASDVGAPHGRFRVFILAANRDHIGGHWCGEWAGKDGWGQLTHDSGHAADTESYAGRKFDRDCESTSHTNSRHDTGRQQGQEWGEIRRATAEWSSGSDIDWGPYAQAIRRWEALRGATPAPTELTPKGKHRLSARFAEWLMGVPAGWITDVPGLSRNEQLKACGNGVVPQQAIAALRDMRAAFHALEVAA